MSVTIIDDYDYYAKPFRGLSQLSALMGAEGLPGLKQLTPPQIAAARNKAQGAANAELHKLLAKAPLAPIGIPTLPPAGLTPTTARKLAYDTGAKIVDKHLRSLGAKIDLPMAGIPPGVLQLVPTNIRQLKQLPATAAATLGNALLEEAGLPGILRFDFPNGITPQAVSDMVYSGVKVYLEDTLRNATGFPIKLPARFTVEDILGTLNPIPDSVEDFLNDAVSLATTYLANYIGTMIATSTSLGASIGSVFPGIGTAIGAAIAAIVGALRAAFEAPPPPGMRFCEGKPYCPEYTGHVSPIEMLPFIANAIQPIATALAKEQKKAYCGKGAMHDCLSYWIGVVENVVPLVKNTPQVLGIPQLDRLIPLYEQAPKTQWSYTYKAKDIDRFKPNAVGREMNVLLAAMRRRRDKLEALLRLANNVETIGAGQVSTVRWGLVTEMRNAIVVLAASGAGPGGGDSSVNTRETRVWFNTIVNLFVRAEKRENAIKLAIQERLRKGKIRAGARRKDPRWAQAEIKEGLMFRCEDGHKPSCRRLLSMKNVPTTRQLKAMGVPDPGATAISKPGRRPGPKRPPGSTAAQKAAQLRALVSVKQKFIHDYLHAMKNRGNRAAAFLILGAAKQPGFTRQNAHAKTVQYLQRKAKAGDKGAQIVLFAATKDFNTKLRSAA